MSFGIFDFNDIAHEELTKLIQIQPVKVYIRGEKRNPRNPNSPLIKQNGWIMESPLDKYSTFEEQMNYLLNILESKMEIFKLICHKYYCEFSCGIFVYYGNEESTPWVHLDNRYNNLIKELNIEFDVDLYVFPNDDVAN